MIQQERIQFLNAREVKKGRYVLYWMQASQRTEYNHALEYAVVQANELRPEGNERHYTFMLEGLREVKRSLAKRGIRLVLQHTSPEQGIVRLAKEASLVVVDRGYLKIQRAWRNEAAKLIDCPLVQVESDVIVPIEETSPKEEYTAATIRSKIDKKLDYFLCPLGEVDPLSGSLSLDFDSFDIEDVEKAVSRLHIDRSVKKVSCYRGGTGEANNHLQVFLKEKLNNFDKLRNDPAVDFLSHLSSYLHFGQISPLAIAFKIAKTEGPGKEAYLEELIVRRELSMNFVFYNGEYDSFTGAIPQWAQKTLQVHEKDTRPYLYTPEELETARTHDPYWNAAQKQMLLTSKMHGYMRMYWGKKIIEWSTTSDEAFRTALYLNNKYELDGRDPNGFAGVVWCFGKHDRPWGEREIFGNVRYMNAAGLKRKFDADEYVRQVNRLKPQTS